MTATPALAQASGGNGGADSDGEFGAGGTGFTGNSGGFGQSAGGFIGGGGGGGAAGGGAGGSGGGPVGGSGGAGGTAVSPNGVDGNPGGTFVPFIPTFSYGDGGGGGGGGYNGNGAGAASLSNSSSLSGGNGGNGGSGGNSKEDAGGGGGGGGGGYGAIVTGATSSSNTSTISGGNGGDGGGGGSSSSGTGGNGGNGGVGGVGVQFTAGGATFINSGTITGGNGGNGGLGGAGIVGSGLTIIDSGTINGGLADGGSGAQANAITFTGGSNILELQAGYSITGNVVGTGSDTFRLGGPSNAAFDVSTIGASAQYQGFSTFVKTGTSIWTLNNTTTAVTPWTINQGTLAVSADFNLGAASGALTFGGGTLQFLAGFTSNRSVTLNAGGGTFDTDGNKATLSGGISGPGGLTKIGLGTLTLSGAGTYSGPTAVNLGTLQAGAVNAFSTNSAYTVASGAFIDLNSFNQSIGSLSGAGNATLGTATLTTGNDNTGTTYSGVISGTGALTKIGTGTFVLSGADTYLGATNVNSGVLEVDGSIASSSLTSVNNGGTLTGIGTVGNTQINAGGTFAPGAAGVPGTAIAVSGNLAFQSGALYLVQVNPTTSTFANVTGNASLAGNVLAAFAPGSYVTKQYDILRSAGLSGSFAALGTNNLPAGFIASLGYTGTDVFLNLTAALATQGLNGNQFNVATSLNNFFNGGGTLAPNFLTIFGLTGGNLANALTQLSGEAATDGQQGAFQMMTQFLGLMLDPFVDGRSGGAGWPMSGGAITGFAPEQQPLFSPDVALAYAGALKGSARSHRSPASVGASEGFDPHWSAWGSGYGGYNKNNGDAVIGSHDSTARTYGFAGGMDYHFAPDTVAGFALAGGGSNWGLAQSFGGGRSDDFQIGVYGKTGFGPAYVAAALAFANHSMSTDRFAPLGDHLTASFNAQSFGGRIEAGYRYSMASIGVTPYAAMQAQTFHTPAYNETDVTSGSFGLGYWSRNASDTRSELGARFDHLTMINTMPLVLRARAAWAHDWVTDPSLLATFQTLPGASFIVNGATAAKNSALASASAELKITRALSLAAKFDGEFASGSQTYAGTGIVRYVW